MKIKLTDFCKISVAIAALFVSLDAVANTTATGRNGASTVVSSRGGADADSHRGTAATVSRTAGTDVVSRASARSVSRGAVADAGRPTSNSRNIQIKKRPLVATVHNDATVSRAAVTRGGISRAATTTPGRSATKSVSGGISRGMGRATAVFDDVSKMGTGYAQCRDAYATCMDQLCAKASDTYRRCFCSAKFSEFRDTEDALDQAKTLLMQFEDNSLNAVDKTAAEVNAMYTATVGEAAIKKDTSLAQKTLSEISDLLSGKKKKTENNGIGATGLISVDFSANMDDIWSGDAFDGGIFSEKAEDLSQLEGLDLYNRANAQCLKIVTDACSEKAVLNMARSSYNILITQDCNAYEKKIDSQREAVKQTARQAEKYLRDARLEEYRAHNSADVNECLAKVRTAILTDTACGEGYKRCLDYSGAYIDQSTGEPLFTPRLFQLTGLIKLDGNANVVEQNEPFDKFLESKRMFAASALDTCRDISDVVWSEFKRAAIIEIAQAQDAKIEEVKTSCVSTMKQCYDTQSKALKSFDNNTAQMAGALSAYAAKSMCADKVAACAALYGGNDASSCKFDNDGHLTAETASTCGLAALLKYVDTVDDVRVAEGCTTAIDTYVKDLCTPKNSNQVFPLNCRTKKYAVLQTELETFAKENCTNPNDADKNLSPQVQRSLNRALEKIHDEMTEKFAETCESMDGYWLDEGDNDPSGSSGTLVNSFYSTMFGGDTSKSGDGWGKCVENTLAIQCANYNDPDRGDTFAKYNATTGECDLSNSWFEQKCTSLGNGYFENGVCYVAE